MKGVIFNELEAFARDRLGEEAWDALIEATPLRTTNGVFVGPKVYPDEDLFALVAAASKATGIPPDELVTAFGEYLFPRLAAKFPMFLSPGHTAKSFLRTVDRVIHVEVHKLHPDAVLPSIQYEDPAPDRLVMLYRSRRLLCTLAAGLIRGVGRHFGETIELVETECTRTGAAQCRFECRFVSS